MTFNISVSGAIFDIFEYDSWDELCSAINAKAAEYSDTFDMNRWAQVDDIPYDEEAHPDRQPLFGDTMRIWVKAMMDSYEHVNRNSRDYFFEHFVPFALWLSMNASTDYSDAYGEFILAYEGEYNECSEFAQEYIKDNCEWYQGMADDHAAPYFNYELYWEEMMDDDYFNCLYRGKQYIFHQ